MPISGKFSHLQSLLKTENGQELTELLKFEMIEKTIYAGNLHVFAE